VLGGGQVDPLLGGELGEHRGHDIAVRRRRPLALDARLDRVVALEQPRLGRGPEPPRELGADAGVQSTRVP
jgi:hypothetical protein